MTPEKLKELEEQTIKDLQDRLDTAIRYLKVAGAYLGDLSLIELAEELRKTHLI